MTNDTQTGIQRKLSLAVIGIVTIMSIGCSSSQNSSTWSRSTPTDGQSLAAADRLGMLVFGSSAVAAEPKLPAHWTLAEASSTD